jgi:hypothetical protein
MKINCGLSKEDKEKILAQWHDFFPIFPRMITSGDCRFFETIQRKGTWTGFYSPNWTWEYRLKP